MSSMPLDDIQVDKDNLYREESFTDMKAATIRCMIPINLDGSDDETRERIYAGQTHVLTQMGALPIQVPMDGAKSLEEALELFPEGAKKGLDQLLEEMREHQRQEASKIVVPQAGQGASPIQMP